MTVENLTNLTNGERFVKIFPTNVFLLMNLAHQSFECPQFVNFVLAIAI